MRYFTFSISAFYFIALSLIAFTIPSSLIAQNVGIGTATFIPLNRLDVKGNAVIGGAAEFRVSSTGDLSRIRNVPYSWPAAQGLPNTVITNDGSGILSWTSPTSTLYNETYFDYNTAGVTATTAGWVILPGMSRTITLTAPAKILCHTDGGIQTTSGSTAGFSAVDCVLFLNGGLFGQGGYERVTVVNNLGVVTSLAFWAKEVIATLAPGTYTIDVRTRLNLGSNANVGGNNASVLQGVLITQVIYQ